MNLPQGETMHNVKVIGCATYQDGNAIGTYDENSYSNTMLYDVKFPDEEIKENSANIIAENMYAHIDAEVIFHSLLDYILDFKKDGNTVDKEDIYVTTKSGKRRVCKTTAGWKLLVLWKNVTEKWIPLSFVKNSKTFEVE